VNLFKKTQIAAKQKQKQKYFENTFGTNPL
jgi:hypothetical protein